MLRRLRAAAGGIIDRACLAVYDALRPRPSREPDMEAEGEDIPFGPPDPPDPDWRGGDWIDGLPKAGWPRRTR